MVCFISCDKAGVYL